VKTNYCLQVDQTYRSDLMVCLNDVPVYDRAVADESVGVSSAPDQWLVPGTNTVSLTMKQGEPGPSTAIAVFVRDMRTNTKLATIRWPQDFAIPTNPAPLGTRTHTFEIESTHERPVFMDAPRTDIPLHGNDLAWAPIEAMVQAFLKGDAQGVFEAIRFKTDEHHRFHGVQESAPETVQKLAAERVKEPYAMQKLDRDITIFEPHAEGRVYRVRRLDGRPVIYGYPATAKEPVYTVNPLLVFSGDRYRILF
jgi:hypothetical protein